LSDFEIKGNKYPYIFPLLFVFVLWAVKLFELQNDLTFFKYGVLPRSIEGLKGILFTPFIHGDVEHLTNNSLPLLVLGTMVFYFYREVAVKISIWIWLLSGFWVWLAARESYHIGASGIVYGLSSFVFFSGLFRKYYKMIAISMLVVFLYGSMIWGVFPIEKGISWEGHLYGGIAGLIMAYYYRKIGPQRKFHEWELEEDEGDYDDIPWKEEPQQNKLNINYVYKPNDKSDT
jgi:membrane associated rhomboid family serine protease